MKVVAGPCAYGRRKRIVRAPIDPDRYLSAYGQIMARSMPRKLKHPLPFPLAPVIAAVDKLAAVAGDAAKLVDHMVDFRIDGVQGLRSFTLREARGMLNALEESQGEIRDKAHAEGFREGRASQMPRKKSGYRESYEWLRAQGVNGGDTSAGALKRARGIGRTTAHEHVTKFRAGEKP